MASVERIHEYSNALEQERNGKRVPAEDWPRQGIVQFKNVALRYRGGPLVLKGITASLAARERVLIYYMLSGRRGRCGLRFVSAATLTLCSLSLAALLWYLDWRCRAHGSRQVLADTGTVPHASH